MLDQPGRGVAVTRRAFILSPVALVAGALPSAARAQTGRIRFAKAGHAFDVLAFRAAEGGTRAAVLVLGGSKGYASESYGLLASVLNSVGFDVFLIEYLTLDDETAMERAGSASARVAFYAGRLASWSETVGITMEKLRRGPLPPTGFGVIGISLGAMPALSACANGAGVAALAIVGRKLAGRCAGPDRLSATPAHGLGSGRRRVPAQRRSEARPPRTAPRGDPGSRDLRGAEPCLLRRP